MVEWKTIGEISSNVFAGGTPSTKHEEYYDGDIPWIRSGEIDFNIITKAERNITKAGYNNSSAKLIRKGSVVMAMTGATVAKSAIVDFETSANQSVCAIEPDTSIADYKYVYYYLAKEYFKIKSSAQGALTSLNLAMIKQIEIPLPSLSEQERIVGILDTFTSSIENLKAQISLRRKQYEHYRDKLLDLEGKPGVEMKTLGEVCTIKNGYTPSTKNPAFWEDGNIPWFTLEDIRKNGRILTDAIKHITPLGVKKAGLFPSNSIIISTTATIGEYALIQTDFLCNQQISCISIKDDKRISSKYLYYIADHIGKWCKKNINGGGSLLIVSSSKLQHISIPLPSLQEQSRIVSILDEFEASIKNLEAQLEARQKQYEYYRNKLLTFE
jgi:type I restriction enzyme S subunit